MLRHAMVALGLLLWPAIPRAEPLGVAAFLAHAPDAATAELVGYVVDIYACPPCPRGMQCKPCMGDHVRISDVPSAAPAASLVVLTRTAELRQFAPGHRYRLLVELRNVRSTVPFVGELRLRAVTGEETK